MNKYEITFIVRPDMEEAEIKKTADEMKKVLTDGKANVVEEDLWISEGTKVGGFSAANEAIGTLVLRFETQKEMLEQMERMDKLVKVITE